MEESYPLAHINTTNEVKQAVVENNLKSQAILRNLRHFLAKARNAEMLFCSLTMKSVFHALSVYSESVSSCSLVFLSAVLKKWNLRSPTYQIKESQLCQFLAKPARYTFPSFHHSRGICSPSNNTLGWTKIVKWFEITTDNFNQLFMKWPGSDFLFSRSLSKFIVLVTKKLFQFFFPWVIGAE